MKVRSNLGLTHQDYQLIAGSSGQGGGREWDISTILYVHMYTYNSGGLEKSLQYNHYHKYT